MHELIQYHNEVFCIIYTKIAFTEAPVSQDVPIGSEAVFRCRHPTADTIRWRVDDAFLGRNPPPDITPRTERNDEGILVDVLTIVARAQYNGTKVECVAQFDNGTPDEQTFPVLLTGKYYHNYTLFC